MNDQGWRGDIGDQRQRRTGPVTGKILLWDFGKIASDVRAVQVMGQVMADVIDHRGGYDGGNKAVGPADDPGIYQPAGALARNIQTVRIDGSVPGDRIQRRHHILIFRIRKNPTLGAFVKPHVGAQIAATIGRDSDETIRRIALFASPVIRPASGTGAKVDFCGKALMIGVCLGPWTVEEAILEGLRADQQI